MYVTQKDDLMDLVESQQRQLKIQQAREKLDRFRNKHKVEDHSLESVQFTTNDSNSDSMLSNDTFQTPMNEGSLKIPHTQSTQKQSTGFFDKFYNAVNAVNDVIESAIENTINKSVADPQSTDIVEQNTLDGFEQQDLFSSVSGNSNINKGIYKGLYEESLHIKNENQLEFSQTRYQQQHMVDTQFQPEYNSYGNHYQIIDEQYQPQHDSYTTHHDTVGMQQIQDSRPPMDGTYNNYNHKISHDQDTYTSNLCSFPIFLNRVELGQQEQNYSHYSDHQALNYHLTNQLQVNHQENIFPYTLKHDSQYIQQEYSYTQPQEQTQLFDFPLSSQPLELGSPIDQNLNINQSIMKDQNDASNKFNLNPLVNLDHTNDDNTYLTESSTIDNLTVVTLSKNSNDNDTISYPMNENSKQTVINHQNITIQDVLPDSKLQLDDITLNSRISSAIESESNKSTFMKEKDRFFHPVKVSDSIVQEDRTSSGQSEASLTTYSSIIHPEPNNDLTLDSYTKIKSSNIKSSTMVNCVDLVKTLDSYDSFKFQPKTANLYPESASSAVNELRNDYERKLNQLHEREENLNLKEITLSYAAQESDFVKTQSMLVDQKNSQIRQKERSLDDREIELKQLQIKLDDMKSRAQIQESTNRTEEEKIMRYQKELFIRESDFIKNDQNLRNNSIRVEGLENKLKMDRFSVDEMKSQVMNQRLFLEAEEKRVRLLSDKVIEDRKAIHDFECSVLQQKNFLDNQQVELNEKSVVLMGKSKSCDEKETLLNEKSDLIHSESNHLQSMSEEIFKLRDQVLAEREPLMKLKSELEMKERQISLIEESMRKESDRLQTQSDAVNRKEEYCRNAESSLQQQESDIRLKSQKFEEEMNKFRVHQSTYEKEKDYLTTRESRVEKSLGELRLKQTQIQEDQKKHNLFAQLIERSKLELERERSSVLAREAETRERMEQMLSHTNESHQLILFKLQLEHDRQTFEKDRREFIQKQIVLNRNEEEFLKKNQLIRQEASKWSDMSGHILFEKSEMQKKQVQLSKMMNDVASDEKELQLKKRQIDTENSVIEKRLIDLEKDQHLLQSERQNLKDVLEMRLHGSDLEALKSLIVEEHISTLRNKDVILRELQDGYQKKIRDLEDDLYNERKKSHFNDQVNCKTELNQNTTLDSIHQDTSVGNIRGMKPTLSVQPVSRPMSRVSHQPQQTTPTLPLYSNGYFNTTKDFNPSFSIQGRNHLKSTSINVNNQGVLGLEVASVSHHHYNPSNSIAKISDISSHLKDRMERRRGTSIASGSILNGEYEDGNRINPRQYLNHRGTPINQSFIHSLSSRF